MAYLISCLIQRKTKVPTKRQKYHLYRSDWKKVYKITYQESRIFFRYFSNTALFENDAQFCKWIKDNFGNGIYFISAWRKGRKGFWSFMKVEILDNRFRRLPKTITRQQRELNKELADKKFLEMRKAVATGEERREIEEDISYNSEIIEDIKGEIKGDNKRGCYPYLKSMKPMYSWHSYEDYGIEKKDDEFIGRMV